MANFTPLLEKDGSIKGTPLQNELKLKIGAEVMLTYNIDVVDGLTNGAFGKIIGFEFSRGRNLKFIMIEFYSERVGRERRNKFSCYSTKYPKATPIGLYESHYSKSFLNIHLESNCYQLPNKTEFCSYWASCSRTDCFEA